MQIVSIALLTISSGKTREKNDMIYFLKSSEFEDAEGLIQDVFGIGAKDASGNMHASYPDLFFERQKSVDFVDLCNETELKMCHLLDVIADAIS